MPTLEWIGKDKVVNHHQDVPFRVLEHCYTYSQGRKDETEIPDGNMIIKGDNLEALKALLPKYEGKINCIYIDPPYNTGNEGWVYNDNVSDPKIIKWLGKVVGSEGEDLSRHDKWLCMMYPRLKLLHKLLTDDGTILISIDSNEYSNLFAIASEIFGLHNYIGTIIWKNANDNNPTNIAVEHEYIIVYARNKVALPSEWKSAEISVKARLLEYERKLLDKYSDEEELQTTYTKWFRENKNELWPFQDYKFIDKGGIYTGMRSVHNPGKEGYRYDVIHPITLKPCTQPLMGYRFPEDTMRSLIESGRIIFGKDETKLIELKVYAKDYRAKLSSVVDLDGRKGANEIKDIFPEGKKVFEHPKPSELLDEILSYITAGNDIILDSFAGTGTTAHAVLKMNHADGGNRKFILIEMEEYAESITAERVRRVIDGYSNVEGTGGSFSFYELGDPLMFGEGNINENIPKEKIRDYIWYMETKQPVQTVNLAENPYYLGAIGGTAYFFHYEKDRMTTLDTSFLSKIRIHAERYIIYADQCTLSDNDLKRYNITFKKIPRDIAKL